MKTSETRVSKLELQRIADLEVPMAGELGIRVEGIDKGAVTLWVPYRASFVRPTATASAWGRP